MVRAVVFAYSEVGYRALEALLDGGVEVPLVFTVEDSPGETRWFRSVAELARERGVDAVTADPREERSIRRVRALAPQYLFSFYYRALLEEPVLAAASWGALNLHGSLLPKYRGRAPVNWAILHGERETGVTLHYMVRQPDAGAIVAQERIAIGIDDTALTVSLAAAAAGARLVTRTLPVLGAGPPPARAMNLAEGSYFGRRTPEDGRIDWAWPAARVHNLIRAVAPPFPGAFTDRRGGPRGGRDGDRTSDRSGDGDGEPRGERWLFAGSHWLGEPARHPQCAPCLYVEGGGLKLDCRDGVRLGIRAVRVDGQPLGLEALERLYGSAPLRLDS